MDWIKLSAKSTNLSGTNGQIIPVSMEELEKHKTPDDCWICVRGKVYNVTHYLDFHPGGVEEMMRGAGTDATELFNEIHRYVNYESMLKKCFVGPLINS
jgi:cytochrome-b5 reductase